jgi:hypothetical protein
MKFIDSSEIKIQGNLSKRAQDLVNRLGGIVKVIDYYWSGRSFLDLPNSGRKTEREVIALCESIIETTEEVIDETSYRRIYK